MTKDITQLSDNKGGPLHYMGNRNLTWPLQNGLMKVEKELLRDYFTVILENCKCKKFKRSYEPFAGSSSWSQAAMELGLAEEYIINDSDEVLINTLRLIRDNPEAVKMRYISLVDEYYPSTFKKDFFLQIISSYNQAQSLNEKSLLLPFIVNHSWGGMIFHDDNGNIVYRDAHIRGEISEDYLSKASLSVEDFVKEVDRVSNLFKINKVVFNSGDFLHTLSDIQEGDFVAMNPPYPETALLHKSVLE
jgi:site-specific DNA-adenine methylase